MLLGCVGGGLAVTALAALSPSYWWFVALFAIGRPLLSATNAIAVVVAAEETGDPRPGQGDRPHDGRLRHRRRPDRPHPRGGGRGLGFRGLFALALVPLAGVPLLARHLEEPDRYQRLRAADEPELAAVRPAVLGRVRPDLRPRLWLLAVLAFGIAFVTGPMNTFLFVYAENALGMSRASTAAMVVLAAARSAWPGCSSGGGRPTGWAAGSPPPAPRRWSRWPGC